MNKEVDQNLLKLLEELNDSMNLLASFNEDKRMPLYEKISDIIKSFQALENMSRSKEFTGSVPLNLIEMIDQGKNPDDYARKLVSEVQNIQEKVAKKQLWMKHLKDSLDPLVALNFPDAASYE